jgi:hypothetical protein
VLELKLVSRQELLAPPRILTISPCIQVAANISLPNLVLSDSMPLTTHQALPGIDGVPEPARSSAGAIASSQPPRSRIFVGVNVGVFFRHEKAQPFQIGPSH